MSFASRPLKVRPMCGECGKPVDSFTEEDGDGLLRGTVSFVARCHGEVERARIRRSEADRGKLNFGVAFEPKVKRIGSP